MVLKNVVLLQKIFCMANDMFICPLCGKEEKVSKAHKRSIVTQIDFKQNGIHSETISQKFYVVRFCSSCDKKQTMYRIARHLLGIIIPFSVVCYFFRHADLFFAICFGLLITSGIYLAEVKIYRDFKASSTQTKDLINRAKEGNAIVSNPFLDLNK